MDSVASDRSPISGTWHGRGHELSPGSEIGISGGCRKSERGRGGRRDFALSTPERVRKATVAHRRGAARQGIGHAGRTSARTGARHRAAHRAPCAARSTPSPGVGLDTPLTLAQGPRRAGRPRRSERREGTACAGAVAVLRGARPGPPVLLRGDMDALPMHEETGLGLRPRRFPGGCTPAGTTPTRDARRCRTLLAARQGELAGEVRFMFQPGEEGFHGARHMIEDGLLEPLPASRVRAAYHAQLPPRRARQPRRRVARRGRQA